MGISKNKIVLADLENSNGNWVEFQRPEQPRHHRPAPEPPRGR
jgi:hypothetical protein